MQVGQLASDYVGKLSPRRYCRCYTDKLPADVWVVLGREHCKSCSLEIGGKHEERRAAKEAAKAQREWNRAAELSLIDLDKVIEQLKEGLDGTDEVLNPRREGNEGSEERFIRRRWLESILWRRREECKTGTEQQKAEWRRYNRLKFGDEEHFAKRLSPESTYWN